jgi:hypothetical protein
MKTLLVGVMSFLMATVPGPMNPLDAGSCHWTTVDAHEAQEFELFLEGNEATQINVYGDGDLGLELYVYDECGMLIGSDTEPQDTLTVWVPADYSGVYIVKVFNSSNQSNSFTVCAH